MEGRGGREWKIHHVYESCLISLGKGKGSAVYESCLISLGSAVYERCSVQESVGGGEMENTPCIRELFDQFARSVCLINAFPLEGDTEQIKYIHTYVYIDISNMFSLPFTSNGIRLRW